MTWPSESKAGAPLTNNWWLIDLSDINAPKAGLCQCFGRRATSSVASSTCSALDICSCFQPAAIRILAIVALSGVTSLQVSNMAAWHHNMKFRTSYRASSSKLTRPAYPRLAGRDSMSHYWLVEELWTKRLICHLPPANPQRLQAPAHPKLAGTGIAEITGIGCEGARMPAGLFLML